MNKHCYLSAEFVKEFAKDAKNSYTIVYNVFCKLQIRECMSREMAVS